MTVSTVRLNDQLCFALYAASNTVIRAYRPLLKAIGLTYPQYLALMTLWQQDGLSVTQIADRLKLPGNAVTPLLARLERLGYLVRTPDPRDHRVVRARLTVRGAALEPEVAEIQRQVVRRTGLDEIALAAIRTQLHALVDQLGLPATSAQPIKGDAG